VDVSSIVADVALGKIGFSPPPPLSLAEGIWRGAYRDTGMTEMAEATAVVQRYCDHEDGLSNGWRMEIQG